MELCSACLDVGYVCDGFPDEIGKVGGDHEVRNVGLKGCARFDDFGPVCVVGVEGFLMMGWAAVVSFELD